MGILFNLFASAKRKEVLRQFGEVVSRGWKTAPSVDGFIAEHRDWLAGLDDVGLRDTREHRLWIGRDYVRALARQDTVSSVEMDAAERLAGCLRLTATEVEQLTLPLLQRYNLWRIHQGDMPTHDGPSPIILRPSERLYLALPAALVEERVTGRQYVGGGNGVSIRIAKGLSYRVGGGRGRSVSERGLVIVSTGSVCLTSRRLAFAGDRKSFDIDWDKLINVEVDEKAMIAASNRGSARMLQFANRVTDVGLLRELIRAAVRHAT